MTDVPFFAAERTWAEHGARYLELMRGALAGGRALQGEPVGAFEAALARRCGRTHAIAVGSGTDALHFALAAAGVGPGDEVIVPAVSFIASASCVLQAGAMPVFADVDEHLLIDLDAAAALLTPRTRGLIVVGLYGQMVDPWAAEAFASAHGVVLVEDAAQAFGAEAGGRPAGATGALSCCSFDPTKTIAAPGSGGAVLCDDDELAAAVRRLRWHGRDESGAYVELGFNSQLPSATAAVLAEKLDQQDDWTARRRAIAARYDEALAECGYRSVGLAPGRTHVFQKYVVRGGPRDAIRDSLGAAGVPTLVHYALPLPRQPLFARSSRAYPRADAACAEVFSLPIHAYLTDDEVERVCGALRLRDGLDGRVAGPEVEQGGQTMPPARKSAKKARAHRSSLPWPPRLPVFEQRHLDLLGLGLVAVGVFLAFPLYLRWDGGDAGQAIVDGMTWAVGRVAWATPVALVIAGVLLVMRPVLPAGVRPFRAGALCLLASACLGLAVGTFGLGPGADAPVADRGGHLGQVMADGATRLFSDVGAHIIALFLFCAALLLLTGATVAGVLRYTGAQVVETTRALRPAPRSRSEAEPEPLLPPDLADEEVVIRPTTRRSELDGALRYPDLFEAAVAPPPEPVQEAAPEQEREPEPEPEPEALPEPTAREPASDDRPPLEHLDLGDVDYRLPDTRILKRSTAEQAKPDTAGQEKTAARC